jgi:hypothetical protein
LSGARRAALGIGYVVGFSPAIVAWAERILTEPRARYALALVVLLVVAIRSEPRKEPAPKQGLVLSIAALGIQWAAMLSGLFKAVALALPVGVLAYTRLTGLASMRSAALAALCLPVPYAIASLGVPERIWEPLATTWIGSGAAQLDLTGWDSGIPLALLFAGLSWYASARFARTWGSALGRAAVSFVLAAPAQIALLALASTLASLGKVSFARAILSDGGWVIGTLFAVGFVEQRLRQELPARAA